MLGFQVRITKGHFKGLTGEVTDLANSKVDGKSDDEYEITITNCRKVRLMFKNKYFFVKMFNYQENYFRNLNFF